MPSHRLLSHLTDAELLEELVIELVRLLTAPGHEHVFSRRLDALNDQVVRRRRRHHRIAHGCTCWVCYDPAEETIHDDVSGPF